MESSPRIVDHFIPLKLLESYLRFLENPLKCLDSILKFSEVI